MNSQDKKSRDILINEPNETNNGHIDDKGYFVIKKTTLYAIAILLFVLYVVGLSIGLIVTLNKQSKEIASLKEQVSALSFGNSDANYVEELDITTMDYYKDFELTVDKYNELINSKTDFMLYFHSDTCSYCKETNVFVNQFIALGYTEENPLYFVTPDVANEIFTKENVESTPTLLVYKADGTKQSYVGTDLIFDALDKKVSMANK